LKVKVLKKTRHRRELMELRGARRVCVPEDQSAFLGADVGEGEINRHLRNFDASRREPATAMGRRENLPRSHDRAQPYRTRIPTYVRTTTYYVAAIGEWLMDRNVDRYYPVCRLERNHAAEQ
jgi:hypothetical protein